MSESDSRRIVDELLEQLKQAAAQFNEHQRAIDELVKQAPSGLPFSDGQLRIVQSGRALKLAFERYQEAVQRYRSFVIEGILPDEDKPTSE